QAPLLWAMYADTADYSEWKNGRRATGLIFSAATFAQKFGIALGGGLVVGDLRFYCQCRPITGNTEGYTPNDECYSNCRNHHCNYRCSFL
ncbi:MFS transporter, partial [bacterium]